jgi:hypothetical protein
MQIDERGYSIEGNVRRARYKLALCQRSELDAMNEARALATGAERHLWLSLAREARQDARHWMDKLREANRELSAG